MAALEEDEVAGRNRSCSKLGGLELLVYSLTSGIGFFRDHAIEFRHYARGPWTFTRDEAVLSLSLIRPCSSERDTL